MNKQKIQILINKCKDYLFLDNFEPLKYSIFFIFFFVFMLILFEMVLHYYKFIPNSIYQPDKYVHYKLVPNSEKKLKLLDKKSAPNSIKINANGFRGKNTLANGKKNILVYGDSFIFAEFSKEENTFCEQFEKKIEKNIKNIAVQNMGIVGYGPDQSYQKLIRESKKYKPELILFSIYAGNDYGDLIRNKLLYINSDKRNTIFYNDRLKPELINDLNNAAFPSLPHNLQIVKHFKNRFPTVFTSIYNDIPLSLTDSNYVNWCIMKSNDDYQSYMNSSEIYCTNIFGDYFDADISVDVTSFSSVTKLILMNNLLCELAKYANQESFKIIVMIIPSKINLISKYQVFYDFARFDNYDNERLSYSIEEMCKQNNLLVVNLFPQFLINDPEKLYFEEGDDHWNDDGQLLAASIVNEFLLRNNIFKLGKTKLY